jgi:hypothetical protein
MAATITLTPYGLGLGYMGVFGSIMKANIMSGIEITMTIIDEATIAFAEAELMRVTAQDVAATDAVSQ